MTRPLRLVKVIYPSCLGAGFRRYCQRRKWLRACLLAACLLRAGVRRAIVRVGGFGGGSRGRSPGEGGRVRKQGRYWLVGCC